MSTVIKPVRWYQRLLSRYVKERWRETLDDFLVMLALLLSFFLIHEISRHLPGTDSFHKYFATLHEWGMLLTYGIGLGKGLWRLIRRRR